MGKVQKATALRSGEKVKAGKKKSYTPPPVPNPDNKKRREAGRQQFYAKEQLTQPATKIVYNQKTKQFETKLYDSPVPFLWDETRKQFVYSPVREERD